MCRYWNIRVTLCIILYDYLSLYVPSVPNKCYSETFITFEAHSIYKSVFKIKLDINTEEMWKSKYKYIQKTIGKRGDLYSEWNECTFSFMLKFMYSKIMSLCGFFSSFFIPQDTNDEDVALFDADEDVGKRSKSKIKYVNRWLAPYIQHQTFGWVSVNGFDIVFLFLYILNVQVNIILMHQLLLLYKWKLCFCLFEI